MGKLEKYISDHRNSFDSDEPDSGHFNRFEERLQKQHGNAPVRANRAVFLKIAAAILLLISISAVMFDFVTKEFRDYFSTTKAGSEMPAEVREAVQYYDNKTNTQIASLCQHVPNQDECRSLSLEAAREIRILDDNTEELKESLILNPGNEHIIDAIIRNQQMKEAMLATIIERISKLKN
jgi:hypothetical protein